MSSAVFYFSKSGVSEKVAKNISSRLECKCIRLTDNVNWKGFIGFLKGGFYAMKEKLVSINPIDVDPANYDEIYIVSPIWGSKMTPTIRTFIHQYKKDLKNVHIVFTLGGDNPNKAISNFLELIPDAKSISFKQKRVLNNTFLGDLDIFLNYPQNKQA